MKLIFWQFNTRVDDGTAQARGRLVQGSTQQGVTVSATHTHNSPNKCRGILEYSLDSHARLRARVQ